MNKKEASRILATFQAHAAMENAAHYLRRGRRFADVGKKALVAEWLAAFRDSSLDLRQDRARDLDDVTAELSLRGMRSPEHLIPADVRKRAAARLAPYLPKARERLNDDYHRFLAEWKARKN
jgi:hypothetical protein